MNRHFATILIMAGLFGCADTATGTIIDEFDSADGGMWFEWLNPSPQGSIKDTLHAWKTETGLSGVLGGSRRTDAYSHAYKLSNGRWTNGNVSVGVIPEAYDGDGVFTMSTGCSGIGEFTLLYDGDGAGLDADLTGSKFIAVTFDPDHLGFILPSRITLTLSDGTNAISSSKEWKNNFRPEGDYTVQFPLGKFDRGSSRHGLNLESISSIQLNYLGDVSHDMHLSSIYTDGPIIATAVPEPGHLCLLAAMLLLGRRRR